MKPHRALRPLGYLELINEAFDLCKRGGMLSLVIACMLQVPVWAVAMTFKSDSGPGWIEGVLLLIVPSLVHAAAVKALYERYLGGSCSLADAWRAVGRRAAPVAVIALMPSVAFAVDALVAPAFPALFLYASSYFLWHIMMIEDTYYFRALRRNWELIRGQGGRVLMALILSALPSAILVGGIVALGMATQSTATSDPVPLSATENLIAGLVIGLLLALLTPLPAALSVVFYVDLRVRGEGFDIEWLARRAGLKGSKEQDAGTTFVEDAPVMGPEKGE
jgi:hypothetical protein